MPAGRPLLPLTPPSRSALMKRVGRKDTAPELVVRRFLHKQGLRFRLHLRQLPGTPDIVLPRYRTVIFVHGCFWHGHDCKHGSVQARTNTEYWREKISENRARDARKEQALRELGWNVRTVWECESADEEALGELSASIRGTVDTAPAKALPGTSSGHASIGRRQDR